MSEDAVYLELSESEGVAHKFYEVMVAETQLKIRYGRIGTPGQIQVKTYETTEKARVEATKKLNEKRKKGYEPAVIGGRQKRALTRRQIVSSSSTAQQAPILWKFDSDSAAFGIFINVNHCWLGNQAGRVFLLDHSGQMLNQFQLPDGVKCIVTDDVWLYVGCDDGNVYDLSGKLPHLAYTIDETVNIYWLDIRDGSLVVSDDKGAVTLLNYEGDSQWTRLSRGQSGWMIRCDADGFYHGHSEGVTFYDLKGQALWHQKTEGAVLFGWQEPEAVYVGTSHHKVYWFTKQGESKAVYLCDAPVYSCVAATDGKYVFAADSASSIYCFSPTGERLWKLGTGCGSALSMQFLSELVYIVTTEGYLACLDASESAIRSAQAGRVPQVNDIKAPKTPAVPTSSALPITSDLSRGVLVECFKEGNQLRVRACSPGYNPAWKVQFPKNIREEGARYLVQELHPSTNSSFYRVYGEIKKVMNS